MDSGLKFELEIKKRPAQYLGLLLLNGLVYIKSLKIIFLRAFLSIFGNLFF